MIRLAFLTDIAYDNIFKSISRQKLDNIKWHLDSNTKSPLYLQVKKFIRSGIINNELTIGSKLSIRKVAKLLNVSRMPVAEAFEILQAEGLLEVIPQSGTVVSQLGARKLEVGDKIPSSWQKILKQDKLIDSSNINIKSSRNVDYIKSVDVDEINRYFKPMDATVKGMKVATEIFEKNDQNYISNSGGCLQLKSSIVKHMKTHGVNTSEENILVTHGIAETLHIISWGLFNRSFTLFYETPSFLNSIGAISLSGVRTKELPMDSEGIDIEKFLIKSKACANPILYTQLMHHNPTGLSTSIERRNSIANISMQNAIPIIENDMFRDFTLSGNSPPPLKASDALDHVVYIGSLWGSFAGVKTLWIIAPKFFIDIMNKVKQKYELLPNLIPEMVTEAMLSKGYYYECVEKIKPQIRQQHSHTMELLKKYLSDIATWHSDWVSFFIWVEFNPDIDLSKLYKYYRKIPFVPGNVFEPGNSNRIKLNILQLEPCKLECWIKAISAIVRDEV